MDDPADHASVVDALLAPGVCRQVRSDLRKLLVGQLKLGHRRLLHLEEITDTPAKPNLWVRTLASIAHGAANARLIMEDGTLYAHAGRLLFSGVRADPSTGQVTLRAEFPNPDGDLFPGMYVRARVQQGIDKNAIVIPQEALSRSAEGQSSVYILDDDYRVTQRWVEAGPLTKDGWVINKGIEPGERVVTDGSDHLTTGTIVKVVAGQAVADAENSLDN